jgi:hypothetical protein
MLDQPTFSRLMTKKNRPRKHHYLPQFYLKAFSVDGEGLYQIDKSTGKTTGVRTKDNAAPRLRKSLKSIGGTAITASKRLFTGDTPSALSELLKYVRGLRVSFTYEQIPTKAGFGGVLRFVGIGPRDLISRRL